MVPYMRERGISPSQRATPRKRCGHVGGPAELGENRRQPKVGQDGVFIRVDENVCLLEAFYSSGENGKRGYVQL
jgi:hypothetical protein